MDEPLDVTTHPKYVNDRACDLLMLKFGYKTYADVRSRIKSLGGLDISNTTFTLARTLVSSNGEYHEMKTKGANIAVKKVQEIAKILIKILNEDHKVDFIDGYFVNRENQIERWGRLLATKRTDTSIFQKIDYQNIFTRFKGAKQVKILHTYITGIDQFRKCCEEALNENKECRFQIMLMEPHSVALHLRERGLSEKIRIEDIMQTCIDNVRVLGNLKEKYPKQLSFQLYDEIPGIIFYQIDDLIFLGHTWYQRFGYEGAYYVDKFVPNNIFHADIIDHFAKMWSDYTENNGFSSTHTFYIHLLRNRQKVCIRLDFNKNSLKARLTDTPYGLDFYGFLFEQSTTNIAFWFVTKHDLKYRGERRCASLHTTLMPSTWDIQDGKLYCGQYTVTTNDNSLRANTVIITKSKNLTSQQENVVLDFLRINPSLKDTTEIKINPTEITTWPDLEDWLATHRKDD